MPETNESVTLNDGWHIRPLVESDHPDWLPLWHQYLAYHGVWPQDAPTETWSRFLDPAEPMHAIGAFSPKFKVK